MSRFDEIIEDRRKKLEALRKKGIDPYPARVSRKFLIQEVVDSFDAFARKKKPVVVAGRVMGIRKQGGLIFLDAQDGSGRIQALLKKSIIKNFSDIKEYLDIGDFISLHGTPFRTNAGEKTIEARKIEIIAKSLRPLPSAWYGLKDEEERYRRRYLDLLLNAEAYAPVKKRSEIVYALRSILHDEGFLEVETPLLQTVAGGATARPFITHSHALNVDVYLRVAPELFLKRLLVAGREKVFEIGRCFRNEGIDREHNPEFTMLELYWAYQDYLGLMKFVEKMFCRLIKACGIKTVQWGGEKVSFKTPWQRISLNEFVSKQSGIDVGKASEKELKEYMKKRDIEFDQHFGKWDLVDEIFKKAVRPNIVHPTFVMHHPKDISPLSKSRIGNPEETERFQLIIAGREVVNGFSELNDSVDQRERMEKQEELFRKGQQDISRLDEDFIEALEYGMPPAAGLGIGIDRLVAVLTNTYSIRDVITFPLLKPRE